MQACIKWLEKPIGDWHVLQCQKSPLSQQIVIGDYNRACGINGNNKEYRLWYRRRGNCRQYDEVQFLKTELLDLRHKVCDFGAIY